jgi:hypothetical protein
MSDGKGLRHIDDLNLTDQTLSLFSESLLANHEQRITRSKRHDCE